MQMLEKWDKRCRINPRSAELNTLLKCWIGSFDRICCVDIVGIAFNPLVCSSTMYSVPAAVRLSRMLILCRIKAPI